MLKENRGVVTWLVGTRPRFYSPLSLALFLLSIYISLSPSAQHAENFVQFPNSDVSLMTVHRPAGPSQGSKHSMLLENPPAT